MGKHPSTYSTKHIPDDFMGSVTSFRSFKAFVKCSDYWSWEEFSMVCLLANDVSHNLMDRKCVFFLGGVLSIFRHYPAWKQSSNSASRTIEEPQCLWPSLLNLLWMFSKTEMKIWKNLTYTDRNTEVIKSWQESLPFFGLQ